jgi:hypothetical protein
MSLKEKCSKSASSRPALAFLSLEGFLKAEGVPGFQP